MKKFLYNNGLSLVFLTFFAFSWVGQIYFGLQEYNTELLQTNSSPVELGQYLLSGHFLQSTFENWESEFLQIALFVLFTIFLQKKGSSESKDFDKEEEVDRRPSPKRKGAPWPVRAGGWILSIYRHSLTIAFVILFVLSFTLHFYGSLKDENGKLDRMGEPMIGAADYILGSRFWFESLQNWQSEFLSIFAIMVLSIFLRQQGSPQSKPVDAPHMETGG